ncbi:hypothetical protein [Mumia sp. DW29H23]|uniref:hypothetical protein n=1 Tax=Mumia sp. DW29H23 TaxID=3421241 RepID=UPI003D69CB82
MGLDADYPAVVTTVPHQVPVWDGARHVIGHLEPPDGPGSHANVTCWIDRSNGRWYRTLSSFGLPAGSFAYVSADLTSVFHAGDRFPLHECAATTDTPGSRWRLNPAVVAVVVAGGVLAGAAALRVRRRVRPPGRPVPPEPPETPHGIG